MRAPNLAVVLLIYLGSTVHGVCAESPVSRATEDCLSCHGTIHPGIVEGWKRSRHSVATPEQASAAPGLASRLSGRNIPGPLQGVVVGCAECHTLNSQDHADSFEHNGYGIHTVVSSKDCGACHTREVEEFGQNLMAHAHENLTGNSLYQLLVHSINGTPRLDGGRITLLSSQVSTDEESCLYCHGTRLTVTGKVSRETVMGEMEFPVISGWPNQGVGRINPDGSYGACSSCHSRHEFSVETARKPHSCKECHAGPDVPALKVYEASKHGNIFSSKQREWNFNSIPWTIGKDFSAPTCAGCHMSLLVNTEGEVISQRTHKVKDRLPWRIFGLIYAHPHPKEPDTTPIRNKDGLPLPADFEGGFAQSFLLNESERNEARGRMQGTCLACHARSWVDGHWNNFMNTIELSNKTTLAATGIMKEIWKRNLASGYEKGDNPFDEVPEKLWSEGWLFYSNSVRFTSAMGGGGDYGVFADGRYQLMKSVKELEEWLNVRKSEKK
jgi:hydroxylamine dehydrogenase